MENTDLDVEIFEDDVKHESDELKIMVEVDVV